MSKEVSCTSIEEPPNMTQQSFYFRVPFINRTEVMISNGLFKFTSKMIQRPKSKDPSLKAWLAVNYPKVTTYNRTFCITENHIGMQGEFSYEMNRDILASCKVLASASTQKIDVWINVCTPGKNELMIV